MRKVILSMMVSIDGYMKGQNDDIHWHVWDGEMSEYMLTFFDSVDTFIYGRKSYELMLSYWPAQSGEFADIMNATDKIVFSRTLKDVGWNARLVNGSLVEEIAKLKGQQGKDLVIFAGADLASGFIKNNLIDEYRLIINPVVLGSGTALFKNRDEMIKLNLIDSQKFDCGNILLRYKPENKPN